MTEFRRVAGEEILPQATAERSRWQGLSALAQEPASGPTNRALRKVVAANRQ
jgi:hypothetical protein